jgi:hypothetical protein
LAFFTRRGGLNGRGSLAFRILAARPESAVLAFALSHRRATLGTGRASRGKRKGKIGMAVLFDQLGDPGRLFGGEIVERHVLRRVNERTER